MKEMYKLTIDDSDDLEFISIVNRLISASTMSKEYETAMITKVKNWFDHKWHNFSGKEVVHYKSDDLVNNDLALEPKWKEGITVPPFNPKRILSSKIYPLNREISKGDSKPLHKFQTSQLNLQNRLTLNPGNQLFAWFSSNSKGNNKGSLMIYELFDKKVNSWYCQIEKNVEWQLGKTKNISRGHLLEILK